MAFDTESERRLDTWIGVIAQALRSDTPVTHTPEGLRIGQKGSLSVSVDGRWYDFVASKGGRDVLSLIRHLRGCSVNEAEYWALGWRNQHLGDSVLYADSFAEDEAAGRWADWARKGLDESSDPLGNPAEAYLRSRGVVPPYPVGVYWLADARLGESAISALLLSHRSVTDATGESVGVQLGYVDPRRRNSVMRR